MFALTSTIVAVALLAVWGPRAWTWWRQEQDRRSASTYLLVPTGGRPDDLDAVGAQVSSLLGAVANRRRSGLVVHRLRDTDAAVRLAVTVYGDPQPERTAHRVAAAVGARIAPFEGEVPSPGVVWYARRWDHIGRDPNDRELPELSEAAQWLTHDALAGADEARVCLSVGIEPVRRWEGRELRRWYQMRAGRSDDTEGVGPGVSCRATVTCWSDDDVLAESVVAGSVAHLHRFPFTVKAKPASSARSWLVSALALVAGPLLASVVAVGRVIAARFSGTVVDLAVATGVAAPGSEGLAEFSFVRWLLSPAQGQVLFLVAALVCAAAGLVSLWSTAPVPNRAQQRWASLHRDGLVPLERPWFWSVPRLTRVLGVRWLNPVDTKPTLPGQQRSLGYPLRAATLALNAHQVAQTVAFPDVADTSATSTAAVDVPAPPEVVEQSKAMGHDEATFLGRDARGRRVVLPDVDRKGGVFIAGDPGKGKTVFALQTWRADAAARIHVPRRRDGQMAMLWLETKGEGANEAEQMLRQVGYQPGMYVRMDVTSQVGPRLDLLSTSDAHLTARRLVGAFRYAFEEGDIGERSAAALQAAFWLALLIDRDIADAAGLGNAAPNVMWVASLLLSSNAEAPLKHGLLLACETEAGRRMHAAGGGSIGDAMRERGLKLMRESKDGPADLAEFGDVTTDLAAKTQAMRAQATTGVELADAFFAWRHYDTMFSARQFAEMFEAPRNKIVGIGQAAPTLWQPSPSRPSVTLEQLLVHKGVGIINFGTSDHGGIDQTSASRLAAVTTYMLWEQVKSDCHLWLSAGRSVGVYADELSHISGVGSGDDVISEMFDKGRSFGVQLCLATQRMTQLPRRTVEAALSFGTRVYLAAESIEGVTAAARDLNGGHEGAFTGKDLRSLPRGTAAARLRFNGEGMPPFTLRVPHVHEDPDWDGTGRDDRAELEVGA